VHRTRHFHAGLSHTAALRLDPSQIGSEAAARMFFPKNTKPTGQSLLAVGVSLKIKIAA